jgi:molybdopterin synthase catalytic subunit
MKGLIYTKVQPEPLVFPLPEAQFAISKDHGAEVYFTGRVRNENQGRAVKALSYDSFVPLAEETLKVIAQESQHHWGADLNIAIVHRIGKLELGDNAVVLAVSSRHRAEAYKASQYIISELKKRAPIWKKEHYFDGDSEWLQGHALCGHDHDSL